MHKALLGSDSILHARCNQSHISYRKPLKTGAYHHRSDYQIMEPGKVRFCSLIARQTGFAQGEFISGPAVIMTAENSSVPNHQRKTTNMYCGFLLRHGKEISPYTTDRGEKLLKDIVYLLTLKAHYYIWNLAY